MSISEIEFAKYKEKLSTIEKKCMNCNIEVVSTEVKELVVWKRLITNFLISIVLILIGGFGSVIGILLFRK